MLPVGSYSGKYCLSKPPSFTLYAESAAILAIRSIEVHRVDSTAGRGTQAVGDARPDVTRLAYGFIESVGRDGAAAGLGADEAGLVSEYVCIAVGAAVDGCRGVTPLTDVPPCPTAARERTPPPWGSRSG